VNDMTEKLTSFDPAGGLTSDDPLPRLWRKPSRPRTLATSPMRSASWPL
jgi:hypothetical protein